VEALATHDQILSSGQYWGRRFPASEKWRGEITRSVDRDRQTLAELGVRGTFGVDFVTSVTDGLLAVEVNLRKVGPSHVLSYVESLVGSSADGHSALQGETSPMHYLHRRVLQPEILCGEQPQVVVDRLRTAGLLYQYDTGVGVILHILGALLGCGYVELTSIATSGADATAIDEAALAVILHS
jgi:hypothetical protein